MAEEGEKGFWPEWMTPRRAWEFAKNVVALEQSVSALREENRDMRIQLARLQQQVGEQNAQLTLLTSFVKDSLSNRLETKIEQLAAKILSDGQNKS